MTRHGQIRLGTIEHEVEENLTILGQRTDKMVPLTQGNQNIFNIVMALDHQANV